MFTVQVTGCNFQYGSNFGVPLVPSFRMLFLLLEECIHDRPLHEFVRDLQCLLSWSIVQFQQHSEILHPYKICSIHLFVNNFSIRCPYLCNRNSWRAGSSSFKSTFVLITLGTRGTRLSSHNGSPRSIVIGFIFFTHFCDCSVKTELIYRSNCAKTVVIVSWSAQ